MLVVVAALTTAGALTGTISATAAPGGAAPRAATGPSPTTSPAPIAPPSAAAPVLDPAPIPTATSDDGSRVVAEQEEGLYTPYGGQVIDISIQSTAMQALVHAFLLLPKTWAQNPAQTYPAMYLLSGAGTSQFDWASWISGGKMLPFMAGRQVITVMPEDGDAGFYTNWVGASKVFTATRPQWQTFHTVELPQLLARGYRTNGVNTIAGISDSGMGVIDYPAMNPGMFKAAACLSCLLDLQNPGSVLVVEEAEMRIGDNGDGPFGSPFGAGSWAARNPENLLAQFKASGTTLWLGSGNGSPGPGDPPAFQLDSFVYEENALLQGYVFSLRARAAGISTTVDYWGNGDHNWPEWALNFPTAYAQTLAPAMGVPG